MSNENEDPDSDTGPDTDENRTQRGEEPTASNAGGDGQAGREAGGATDDEDAGEEEFPVENRADTSVDRSSVQSEEVEAKLAQLDEYEAELDQRASRLEQRERGLDGRAEELDERETELQDRANELDERRDRIAEMRDQLETQKEELDEREADLDDRETTIEAKEGELKEYAQQLEEKEETLREYVEREVHELEDDLLDNVRGAVTSSMDDYQATSGRLGVVGGIITGLVGLALLIGGVVIAVGTNGDISSLELLSSNTANYALGGGLAFIGLVVNLAAVADRL